MKIESLDRRVDIPSGLPQILKQKYHELGLKLPEIVEKPQKRYPIIEIFGPPGGGKTETANRLGARFGCRVFPERSEENPFVGNSYGQSAQETAFKSQETFLLLKFQSYMEALKDSVLHPVIIEPSINTDFNYAAVFMEEGKINSKDTLEYLQLLQSIEPFLFIGDIGISVVPDLKILKKRISQRGRDYEVGFSDAFLIRMMELSVLEEKNWAKRNRCFSVGNLNYDGTGHLELSRGFGLFTTGLLGNNEFVCEDGSKVICPDGWGNFKKGKIFPDDCRYKLN